MTKAMKTKSPVSISLLLLGWLVTSSVSPAAVITWTNLSGGNWNVAANWSTNQVPSTNDIAIITNAGTYTVTLNVSPTLAGLVLGGPSGTQVLAQAGNTLTLNGPGSLGPNGRYNWSGGTLGGAGGLAVATGGQVNLSGNTTKTLSGSLTNAGMLTWTGTAMFTIGSTGVLHNLRTGVMDIQCDELLNYSSGSPLLINDGSIRKTAGTGTTTIEVGFVNSGTVDAQVGVIRFNAQDKVFSAGSQFLGAGTNLLDSGNITLAGSLHAENLELAGAALAGEGTLSGTMSWSSGNIATNARLTVAADGVLQLRGNAGKYLYGALTNAGWVTWSGIGMLTPFGVIHNQPGGVFEARNDEVLNYSSGTPLFINDGVFRKAQGTGTTSVEVEFVNNGTVDVQTGTVQFGLQPKTLNAGCRFIGAGVSSLFSSTTITLAGAIESENLALNGATVAGAGSVIGSFTWNSGTLTPDVSFNIATNGLLLLASASPKILNGTITNAGVVRWTGLGNLRVQGAIHNLPAGLFDIQNNEVLDYTVGSPVVVNDGTFRKSAGALTTICQIPFLNRGRVEINSGTVSFSGTTFNDQGGVLALGGGTLQAAQPLILTSGLLTGWGTVGTDLTNAGCIRPSRSNGMLTISGRCEQLMGGRMEFEVAGNDPGTNQSRLNITGAATLRGTIGVLWSDGYVPSSGTNFPVLGFASRSGEFCCFDNFLLLGQGRRLMPVYTSTSLTLATAAAPEPTNIPLRVAVDGGVLVCWPVEFPGYELYWSTNLYVTNWMLIAGATNRFLETPPLVQEKFFRLHKP